MKAKVEAASPPPPPHLSSPNFALLHFFFPVSLKTFGTNIKQKAVIHFFPLMTKRRAVPLNVVYVICWISVPSKKNMNVCCVKVTVPNFLRYPLFWVLGNHWSLPPAPLLRDISPSHVSPSRDFNFTASCGGCCCGLCDHSAPGHFSSYAFSLLPPRRPPLLIRLFHLCRFFHHPLFPEEHEEKLMKIYKHHH